MTARIILFLIAAAFSAPAWGQDTVFVKPPTRLVWQGEKGVFLNNAQETLTLEKLQWKEVYKNDAVTFYLVSLQLNDKVRDLEAQNVNLRNGIRQSEGEALAKNSQVMALSSALKDERDANLLLRDEKMLLRRRLTRSIVLNVGLSTALVGTAWILTR